MRAKLLFPPSLTPPPAHHNNIYCIFRHQFHRDTTDSPATLSPSTTRAQRNHVVLNFLLSASATFRHRGLQNLTYVSRRFNYFQLNNSLTWFKQSSVRQNLLFHWQQSSDVYELVLSNIYYQPVRNISESRVSIQWHN